MKIKSILISAVLATTFFCFSNIAAAQTPAIDQLKAQIQELMKKLQVLQAEQGTGTQSWCHTFNYNMSSGQKISGSDTEALATIFQKEGLINQGTTFSGYDEVLASAVTGFQEKYASEILTPNNLKHGTGIIGKSTRAKLNTLYGCGAGQMQVQSDVTNLVTPQQKQMMTTDTTVPNNGTLCNGVNYGQCLTGNNFVCPVIGAGYCESSQSQLQTKIQNSAQLQNLSCSTDKDCPQPACMQVNLPPPQNSLIPNQFEQPPVSCNGHTPTDLNLPPDCASWNASHGMVPPTECMGKKPNDTNLPQSCIKWFSIPQGQSGTSGGFVPQTCSVSQVRCVSNKCVFPTTPTQPMYPQQPYQTNTSNQQPPASCMGHMPTDLNLPADCAAWNASHPMTSPVQAIPYQTMTTQTNTLNLQPPASCMGHMPTDLNIPADCVAWNTANGIVPPTECIGKRSTDTTLSQTCVNWFALPISKNLNTGNNQQPIQTNTSNQQPPASCMGHMPTDLNLPADCAAWNASHPMMSPQQSGVRTLPPSCVGKTSTTANLPQECQIWFGIIH